MKWLAAVVLAVGLAAPARAGELVFTNGNHVDGDLANEALVVSTGSGLVEVSGDQVVLLTQDEVRLRDGRVFRGTVVGGEVTARTARGELAVQLDELQAFRSAADADPGVAGTTAALNWAPDATPASRIDPLPVTSPPEARRFEVVAQSILHRDAFAAAARAGRVIRGELVTYLDFIDRRLRILNTLVFDGGFWIKVQAADGTEGWLPASLLRAVR